MTTGNDVTASVKVGDYEGGIVPLERCVCGREFRSFDFNLWEGVDNPEPCPDCGRRFHYQIEIKVFEVKEV